ncbi:hypothetical protein FDI38_gp071 [Streptomyces phage Peebs]|uniref:KTSC domain-containing protein n=1 Tax=Streptomyces phage Peebs TaxID=2023994 RepID=A0A222Z2S9_9CAUD|nr:hypothetical protein FDI38_gp071 [Streptomyces phage Peebs]ASR77895.1 hypothetical protein SEA_PEEBS_236 [Streptomyces phage Peebs]
MRKIVDFIYTNAIGTNSSALQGVYWNKNSEELVVQFWGGSVIKYTGFNEDDYRAFASALSKGRFYSQYVKGNFRGEKMDNETNFVHEQDVVTPFSEVKELEAEVGPSIQVTVNIYVNGDPDSIAKAVERLAPSIRAVQNWRG